MAILVTGAAGYVGNNTVRRLVAMGKSVKALVRDEKKAAMRLQDVADRVTLVTGDVSDRAAMRRAMEDVTAVIHLVAIPMERGSATYEEINYQGTVNVVDAAVAAGVDRFINMSQNGATPDHFSRFLRSKGRAQAYVAASSLKWTAVHPSVIFGPQDEFFNAFARLIRLTPIIFPLIGGGKALFQPVSVHDVVESMVRSLDDDGTIGREFALGGPEVLNLGEIEKRILKAMGESRALVGVPVGLLRPAVFVMEKTLPGTPVNLTLLELLGTPNTVSDNALVSYFRMEPRAFAGDNIAYLRDASAGSALRRFFTGQAVN
ncbi:MAG: SDR family NAD(P)-dependent oxidoreductase [Anaerolineae bacterium]|nr:SDR family NAD(P)-dependent oxidoreductase [Anaerolineae bacterium]NUQ03796.1 SDR family NAD(P)-dependent oxidoreductase [Anaerolineae bacterium]